MEWPKNLQNEAGASETPPTTPTCPKGQQMEKFIFPLWVQRNPE